MEDRLPACLGEQASSLLSPENLQSTGKMSVGRVRVSKQDHNPGLPASAMHPRAAFCVVARHQKEDFGGTVFSRPEDIPELYYRNTLSRALLQNEDAVAVQQLR